jgi:uncharacterized Zn finger protein (UPF0148 family)
MAEGKCSNCGMPVYPSGEGTWFGPDGKLMCPGCADAKITPDSERVWDPEKGCWVDQKGEPSNG